MIGRARGRIPGSHLGIRQLTLRHSATIHGNDYKRAKNTLELSDTFTILAIMNLQTKRCLRYLGLGGASGILALVAVLLLGSFVVSKGSSLHTFITKLSISINKPLELVPGLEFLADRQDPVLSIGFIAVYWATLGMLVGGVTFVVLTNRRTRTGRFL
jgi:hypothetical protein